MKTIDVLTVTIAVLSFTLASFIMYHIKSMRYMRRQMDDMCVQRSVRLELAGKRIKVTFFLRHGHRLLSLNYGNIDWINDIRDHLNINSFGQPGFESSPWRSNLRDLGYRNPCIIEDL